MRRGERPHSIRSCVVEQIGWGILATGKIARGFATNLRATPGARIAAVGSRSAEAAQAFAWDYAEKGTRFHGSYADLVADPSVDIVYIASPHSMHLDHARLAFDAGKPVLCEKALTLNARDAEEMIGIARDRELFLMEAMWMACHPVIREILAQTQGRPVRYAASGPCGSGIRR